MRTLTLLCTATTAAAFATTASPLLIYFNTSEATPLLVDAVSSPTALAFQRLSNHVQNQQSQAFCAIATVATIFNALTMREDLVSTRAVTPDFEPYHLFTQASIFSHKEECVGKVVGLDVVHRIGTTLPQVAAICSCYGFSNHPVHASSSSVHKFRAAALQALQSGGAVAVNWGRQELGQSGGGHWSPLGGYAPKYDAFLILDVTKYKYPYVWADTPTLFAAMNTPDTDSGLSRGYITFAPYA